MKKIKICHVTSVHPPFDIRIYHKECRSLARAGFHTYLVATNVESQVRDGVHIHGVELAHGNRLERIFKSSKKVMQAALEVDADVYHLHDPELLLSALGLKQKGKVVFYDSHEDLPRQTLEKDYIHPFLRPILAGGLEAIERFVCSRLDGVITATPKINERFLKINRNSINISNFPFTAELQPTYSGQPKEDAVCYVGSIARIRGISHIVEAIGKAKGRLILAGAFEDSSLRDRLAARPEWSQVDELGYLDRPGVRDVMARSRAGLVTLLPAPNHLESVPIKMFEYLSAGIPIIASDFPLWRRMLNETQCVIFVDPENPAEIADAIGWIMDNPGEAEEMGRRGRRLVVDQYNWEAEETRLVEFYRNTLQKLDH